MPKFKPISLYFTTNKCYPCGLGFTRSETSHWAQPYKLEWIWQRYVCGWLQLNSPWRPVCGFNFQTNALERWSCLVLTVTIKIFSVKSRLIWWVCGVKFVFGRITPTLTHAHTRRQAHTRTHKPYTKHARTLCTFTVSKILTFYDSELAKRK